MCHRIVLLEMVRVSRIDARKFPLSMITFSLLAAAGTAHLAYWWLASDGLRRAQRRDARIESDAPPRELPPVSVVVAARNEQRALPRLLQALAAQTHPHREIVIVDDASTDDTASLARAWTESREEARLVQIEPSESEHKKRALTRGIRAARHDLLALTDADCAPPPGWLEALARRHAARDADQVLVGYSPLERGAGLLGRLAAYETLVTGVLTAGAAGKRRPYMAVGRNLSYPRAVFERVDGFAHSEDFICGDDDLFVQEVARRDAARVRPVFEAAVPSEAPSSWGTWLRRKRRHAAAARHYPRGVTAHLAALHGTGALLWTAPLWAGAAGVTALAAKLIGQGLALRRDAEALSERSLRMSWPLSDLLHVGYALLAAPLGLAGADEW
jgi:cellulose synthase/poly-beta-1,6-N-acetylglucosamine synthase-like glycosyltransferase